MSKYPSQKLTNEDKQILDQIIIKYALNFFALTEKYPNPKQYAEQIILKRMRYYPKYCNSLFNITCQDKSI